MKRFVADQNAWADFFITRIGLILFASMLLLAAFKVYPMFKEQEARAVMDAEASDIASKIEAVDAVTVPGYRYINELDEKNKDMRLEISTGSVVARYRLSTPWGERELVHAEPLITHVYPPNSNWSNTSGLRKKLSDVYAGKNGEAVSPLDLSDKSKVDKMFENLDSELAGKPFLPDNNMSLILEKVIIHYVDGNKISQRDYVLIYQR